MVWWLWNYTFSGRPIGRCSWNSGLLHGGLRRSEHQVFSPVMSSPTTGRVSAGARSHGPAWAALAGGVSLFGFPQLLHDSCWYKQCSRQLLRRMENGLLSVTRVVPSSPVEKSIAQTKKCLDPQHFHCPRSQLWSSLQSSSNSIEAVVVVCIWIYFLDNSVQHMHLVWKPVLPNSKV